MTNHCSCCPTGKALREKENLPNPTTIWKRFEYSDGWDSNKFWSIKMDFNPQVVWLKYGKIGTKGTLIKKEFDWSYEARNYYTEKVREKLGKNYTFVGNR